MPPDALRDRRREGIPLPGRPPPLGQISLAPRLKKRTRRVLSEADRLEGAVNGLRRSRPELSAAEPTRLWQRVTFALISTTTLCAIAVAPAWTLQALLLLLAVPFLSLTLLRIAALWNCIAGNAAATGIRNMPLEPQSLPTYSVLAPLYGEAAVAADLVAALSALDYPAEKLEILLILEAGDKPTLDAVRALQLPAHMRTIVVPEGTPRTKPRALNYALTFATAEYVVVYDAEDLPEPDQLRRAVALLASSSELGCVQAQLNVYNSTESWLTRQFTIEYTSLFDCLLPALQRLGLPVPLGGTSNHFPRRVLEAVGAWDPYNVTEDADLGIRLARQGWKVAVLSSTTWEEAPPTFASWRKQRTRWLKGWMQTYLVHMREPLKAARDLGLLPFVGLHTLMGGVILSAVVHPWFYVLLALDAEYGILRTEPGHPLAAAFWWIGILNLVTGYAAGVALGCVAVARRGQPRLALAAVGVPMYWLLISFAAYRALLQLVTAPYRWEKTEHRARSEQAARNAG